MKSAFSKQTAVKPRPSQQVMPVSDIMDILQGTATNPIDLTDSERQQYALTLLDETPMRFLHFHQDVRPPYYGTWTRPLSPHQIKRLARNPRYQLDTLDYDYDSEAEWEEPEEGEELHSDDDEEEDEDEDDMDDFLDDANERSKAAAKRGLFISDLVPVSSGLQWEDCTGKLPTSEGSDKSDFSQFAMGILLGMLSPLCEFDMYLTNQDTESTTIDPYSTEYWRSPEDIKKQVASTPARPALLDKTKQINGLIPQASSGLKPARLVPPEDLENFKTAINGQDLTKIAMVEHLKRMYAYYSLFWIHFKLTLYRFPKVPKDAIANTLNLVAERESKKATAKWRLKST
jgi:chromatin assembly factor 1 subunit A